MEKNIKKNVIIIFQDQLIMKFIFKKWKKFKLNQFDYKRFDINNIKSKAGIIWCKFII